MTVTVSQIITEAYRESNNIPVGTTPTTNEQNEAVLIFNRLVKSMFGNEAGDAFETVNIGNNNVNLNTVYNYVVTPVNGWFPPVNSRLVFNNTVAQTIYLNPYPMDGERFAVQDASGNLSTYPVTLVGNGRTIDGSNTAVLNTNGLKREWFFRADLGDWQQVSDLTLASTLPFPTEFEDLFILGLALRINPRNGTPIDGQSVETYKRLRSLFKARYTLAIDQRAEEGLLRLLGERRASYPGRSDKNYSTQRFNSGYPS